jgi:hypothetical protein
MQLVEAGSVAQTRVLTEPAGCVRWRHLSTLKAHVRMQAPTYSAAITTTDTTGVGGTDKQSQHHRRRTLSRVMCTSIWVLVAMPERGLRCYLLPVGCHASAAGSNAPLSGCPPAAPNTGR